MNKVLSTAAAVALGLGMLGAGAVYAADATTSTGAATTGATETPGAATGTHMHKRGDRGQWLDKAFSAYDTDKDGKVSETEFVDHMKTKFKKADADGDGYVTKEEAQKYADSMRQKHKEHRRMHKMDKSGSPTGGATTTPAPTPAPAQ
jgi:hypothetical protein